jgi:branched-chain amino acid transport system substrate-binding protein
LSGNSRFLWLVAVAMTAVGSTWARADVPIAAVGPLTGQNIWRGEQIQQGAQMAVADINARGGVLDQRIALQVADDACDPDQAVAVAKKLAAEGILFVAGHTCSHSSIPASKVYEKAGILMISPASTNPKLTDEGGANVFRVVGRDDRQGLIAGNYLADVWGDKKIAVLHDNSTYGKGLANETRKQLNERGVKEAMYEAFVPGERDYSPLVSKMQAAGIDVFYLGGYSTEAGLIVRQARNQGFEAQLVSGDALTTEEFWMITGPAGEGALATFAPDPRRNPGAAPIVERFRAQSFEPSGYTLHTYAAVQVWAQAVEMAGTLALDAVIASLQGHKFDTVLGTIGFDELGDITAPSFVWYVWRNGEYVQKN